MQRHPWLCLVIVGAMGLTAQIGLVGIIVANMYGRPPDSSLVAIVSTCVGSLASFLVNPPRNSVGYDQPALPPKP